MGATPAPVGDDVESGMHVLATCFSLFVLQPLMLKEEHCAF